MKIKRLLSNFVDFTIIVLISTILMNVTTCFKPDLLSSTSFLVLVVIVCSSSFLLLIVLKDIFLNNYSLGKKIFNLVIVSDNGELIDSKKILIKRNIVSLLFLGVNIITILISNKSIGDYVYKTNVIDKNLVIKVRSRQKTKSKKMIIISILIFISFFVIIMTASYHNWYKQIDSDIIPKIYNLNELVIELKDIKRVSRDKKYIPHDENNMFLVRYNIETENNIYNVLFYINIDTQEIINFDIKNIENK